MDLASPAPDARPAPRISEWFSESFTLFGRAWGVWLLQGLLFHVLPLLPVLPGLALCAATLVRVFAQFFSSGGPSAEFPQPTGELLVGAGVLAAGALVSVLLIVYLLAGMTRTAAKQLRGEPISVGDLFTAGDVLLPDFGAYLVINLALSLGFSFFFIPGLLLAGIWLFVHPLIVERRLAFTEAFRESTAATRPHLATFILWTVLMYLVYSAGSVIAVIGVVASLPLAILMWVVSYRDTFGLPGAVPAAVFRPAGMPAATYAPEGAYATRRCPRCGGVAAPNAAACPTCGTPLSPDSMAPR